MVIAVLFTALVSRYFSGVDYFTEWLFTTILCMGSVLLILSEIDSEWRARKRREKKKRIYSNKVRRWSKTFGYVEPGRLD
jgi:hypothetical protein